MFNTHYNYNTGYYMSSQLHMQTILCDKNDLTNFKKKYPFKLEKSQNYQTSSCKTHEAKLKVNHKISVLNPKLTL